MHGEASFCAALVPPGSRILDAGCGTGRVAIRLAELGYDCVGVDCDESMLAQAALSGGPAIPWILADLATMTEADLGIPFDLVVAAGNVIPLVAAGSEAATITNLATSLVPQGILVVGFGLDASHLPLDNAPFGLTEYDKWCTDAGLTLQHRYAAWDGAAYDGGGYAVSVHTRV
jgi:predicted TPR repeat methyltransferase